MGIASHRAHLPAEAGSTCLARSVGSRAATGIQYTRGGCAAGDQETRRWEGGLRPEACEESRMHLRFGSCESATIRSCANCQASTLLPSRAPPLSAVRRQGASPRQLISAKLPFPPTPLLLNHFQHPSLASVSNKGSASQTPDLVDLTRASWNLGQIRARRIAVTTHQQLHRTVSSHRNLIGRQLKSQSSSGQ